VLTGEIGTGKTTLCRAVIDALGQRTFAALILNPYMSDSEVLRVILREFGLVSRDEIRQGAFATADMPQLMDTLENFLRSLISLNSYAVVMIDEAQNLAPRVLDQIRMLGSFEQDGQRLLQVVLVGQPSLLTTLESETLKATNDRVSRRIALTALQSTEVDGYIRHRLAIAGGKDGVSFEPDAVQLVSEFSRRLPRKINLLCDRTLEEGRVAGTTVLRTEHVRRANKALAAAAVPTAAAGALETAEREITPELAPTFGHQEAPRSRVGLVVAAVMVVVLSLVSAGAYAYVGTRLIYESPGVPPVPEPPIVKVPKIQLPPPPTEDQLVGKFGG
jgi:general secretion pathway protein A